MYSNKAVPRVSLVIFTYNQEDTIISAIDSALGQDYPDLHVVISDDCSTDDTYKICESYLETFKPNRRVTLRRSKGNNGTYAHLLDVANDIDCDLLIAQAGDDMSKSNRVSVIVSEWMRDEFTALFSNYDTVCNDGEIVSEGVDHSESGRLEYVFGGSAITTRTNPMFAIAGCTSAYNNKFLRSLPRPKERIFCEDALLSYLITALDLETRKVPESLLFYRQSAGSVSAVKNARTIEDLKISEMRREVLAEANHAMYGYLLSFFEKNPDKIGEVAITRLTWLYDFTSFAANFWSLSVIDRLGLSLRYGYRKGVLFLLPRIFGLRVYLWFRKFFLFFSP